MTRLLVLTLLLAACSTPAIAASGDSAITAGVASWYRDLGLPADGLYAAVPSYTYGDPRYRIRVCRLDGPACVDVEVRDYCQCPGDRIVDLSSSAFQRLAPLSQGLVRVTVSDAPHPTPPQTDTGGTR